MFNGILDFGSGDQYFKQQLQRRNFNVFGIDPLKPDFSKQVLDSVFNKTIDDMLNGKDLTLDEIKKAINIVKSNYIFNLETSTQLSSFFGNELLWGRKSSINNLESHLKYWNDLDNFKEITEFIRGEKYTLVASPGKC